MPGPAGRASKVWSIAGSIPHEEDESCRLRRARSHRFSLDEIEKACELFSHQRDGVIKIAITP
jgi:threonine dehydrogenase-like Zn-dependent dehydrogenase